MAYKGMMVQSLDNDRLRTRLITVLGPSPDCDVEIELVDACHRIACAYLRAKAASGRFQARPFGLSLADFAAVRQ